MKEEELLIAQAEDKIRQCLDWNTVTSTNFLDLHQQSILHRRFDRTATGCGIVWYGGYEGAERCALFCVPEYFTAEDSGLITAVRVTHAARARVGRSGRKPGHGDYLGAMLGLGIKREMTGDILVREDGADILVTSEIAEFLVQNFTEAGRMPLHAERIGLDQLIVPEVEVRRIRDTVASLRLDSVLASAFGLARGKAQEAIRSGLVFVNSCEELRSDRMLEEGDRIVLRHSGRAVLTGIGGTSRKGRTVIEIERW